MRPVNNTYFQVSTHTHTHRGIASCTNTLRQTDSEGLGRRGGGVQGTSSRVEKQKHLPFICVPFCIIKMCSLLFFPPLPTRAILCWRRSRCRWRRRRQRRHRQPTLLALCFHICCRYCLFVCLPACYILLCACVSVCACMCVCVCGCGLYVWHFRLCLTFHSECASLSLHSFTTFPFFRFFSAILCVIFCLTAKA